MNKLILASSSPRRRDFLEILGINIENIKPDKESLPQKNEKPWDFVKRVSNEKMGNVLQRLSNENNYILAADTIVVFNGKIIGKPQDNKQWEEYLLMMSDNWHKVYTGYTLKCPKKKYSRVIKSTVHFIKIDNNLLEWYLSTNEGYDKAGGYAVQGKGAVLVKEIRGSFTNVIGLPLSQVVEDLKRCSFF